jgi:dienelactone hydrolase
MDVIFVSHPYRADTKRNQDHVRDIARKLAVRGFLPLAPQIYLPLLLDETTERALALKLCLRLVGLSDLLRVYGEPTEGMRLEIIEAQRLGIPVVRGDSK